MINSAIAIIAVYDADEFRKEARSILRAQEFDRRNVPRPAAYALDALARPCAPHKDRSRGPGLFLRFGAEQQAADHLVVDFVTARARSPGDGRPECETRLA